MVYHTLARYCHRKFDSAILKIVKAYPTITRRLIINYIRLTLNPNSSLIPPRSARLGEDASTRARIQRILRNPSGEITRTVPHLFGRAKVCGDRIRVKWPVTVRPLILGSEARGRRDTMERIR